MTTWRHSDPELAASVKRAAGLALQGKLATAAEFRAWLVWASLTQATLYGAWGVTQTDGQSVLDVELASGTGERAEAAATLARTVDIFATAAGWRGEDVGDVVTSAPREAGLIPALVAGTVVRLGAFAAVAWASQYAFQVVDHELNRRAKLRELERTDAEVRALVEAHAEREVEQGQQLPLDTATKQALSGLQGRQALATQSLANENSGDSGIWGWLVAAAVVAVAAFA